MGGRRGWVAGESDRHPPVYPPVRQIPLGSHRDALTLVGRLAPALLRTPLRALVALGGDFLTASPAGRVRQRLAIVERLALYIIVWPILARAPS